MEAPWVRLPGPAMVGLWDRSSKKRLRSAGCLIARVLPRGGATGLPTFQKRTELLGASRNDDLFHFRGRGPRVQDGGEFVGPASTSLGPGDPKNLLGM